MFTKKKNERTLKNSSLENSFELNFNKSSIIPNNQTSQKRTSSINSQSRIFEDEDDTSVHRIIYINDCIKNQQAKFLHNSITTAKYNFFTFLPKFLIDQFSKYANLFFLFTACIQQIPEVSPTNRFGTVVPLSMVLLASAVKELIEDAKRHTQDKTINQKKVKALAGNGGFVSKLWKDVVVGDIVRIENGEFFPADLILLSSSEPEALCYIETSNLDGETNLKIRQGLPETMHILTPEEAVNFEGIIKSELPNNSLYTYEGTLRYNHKELALDPISLLLRGAVLRNTRWVYGVVVFTGHETKLMKNATKTPIKRTKVENVVNTQIIFLFCILLSMALCCALVTLVRSSQTGNFEEIILKQSGSLVALEAFPLIVTMEFVKFFLGTMINSDLDMYYEESDTPATARTSSLVEELGQVDYIFSDKTGTLTCNIMDYRMCCVAGSGFAQVVPDDKKIRVDESGKEIGYHDFEAMKRALKDSKSVLGDNLREFYTLLAVCHTVIPETNESGDITYQASSPDEAALVKGAVSAGYIFTTRKPKSVTIHINGIEEEFEILNICEFNSTRKRMSAVVRLPDGTIKLYIKGADTVILERLSQNNPYVDSTCVYLEEYATEGLRTLCLAVRTISEEEYSKWSVIYEKAATTINNRGDALDAAAELIEKDLMLLGATAIEDKLQDGVPETIATLALAGIKIWVLTGDRQETAINIGFSCKLITEEMSMIVCNETTHHETKKFLMDKLELVKYGTTNLDSIPDTKINYNDSIDEEYDERSPTFFQKLKGKLFKKKKKLFNKDIAVDNEPLALIIDGKSLSYALEPDVALIFLELATHCKAVICCRVSPLQKALVVKLVKKNVEESVTLAIGDGANDVSMIQAAHVGVGISGQEGLQAARSADFAIAQFRFLKKLLLVHGNWAYSRLSKLILYSFYKNITLYLIQMWFALDNGFSGQVMITQTLILTLFETWTVSAYNIAFAVFQPVAIGLFDTYVSARMLDRYPQLYRQGQKSLFYNNKVFWYWLFNCFFHSMILYQLMKFAYGEGTILADGRLADNWLMGETVYTMVLITITWKAAIVVDVFVKFTYVAIFGSIALWFVLFPIYATVAPMRNYRPHSYHIIQEIQKFNIPDYRPRMEWFRKAVHKVRQIQRLKRNRGFAFSQNESGQAELIRVYDTTKRKPTG
ncbi:hypothetical protein HK099_003538 [Clydaea vesicula]|uniref:Phospholipid-transporting ATPase n=1 Tax=Clydaea vesicula TaxID=447962 RepID=A0AAD5U1J0_9FUNG|nr:hypothetical protein HK099_003538 [Clydaea vesicula]